MADLDVQAMTEIAKVAAEAAAERIGGRVREDVRKELESFRQQLKSEREADRLALLRAVRDELRSYHGEMTPSAHLMAHAWIDEQREAGRDMRRGFFQEIGGTTGKILLFIIILALMGAQVASMVL